MREISVIVIPTAFFQISALPGGEMLLWIGLAFGFYMAWNIGANDVANAMGTSVGSGALTFRRAVIYAAIFEFLGAVLVGSHVTDTVRKGIIDPQTFAGDPMIFALGMTAALLGSAAWLHIASSFAQPASTTHSIVGGIFGFGLVVGGPGCVSWDVLAKIVLSWVVSPLCGAIIAIVLFRSLVRRVLAVESPARALQGFAPVVLFFVGAILCLSLFWKGLKNLKLDMPLGLALLCSVGVGLIVALLGWLHLRRKFHTAGESLEEQLAYVERNFRGLQVVTACYVAFAHGANDVANAVGPLAAMTTVVRTGDLPTGGSVPLWILLLGGFGIMIGLATYGRKVMETVGSKITEMTPSRGFTAEFAAATTVLICSKFGLPISTTHTLVGAVIGVGIARGLASLDIKVVRNIAATWLVTIPAAALATLLIYTILRAVVM